MEKKTINSNNVGDAHSEPPRSWVYVCIPRQNAIYVLFSLDKEWRDKYKRI